MHLSFLGHVNDPPVRDAKVRMPLVYIHIQIASATFARDTPEVKNSVVQTKRTPTELLKVKHSPEVVVANCGAPTTGYELVREFATTCDPPNVAEPERKATSPKYASDTSLHLTKKRSENNARQKPLKQCQRSSFVSYVDFNPEELTNISTPSSVPSRRRIKSDGYDPDDLSKFSEEFADELPPLSKTLPVQAHGTRPESYMFALRSQNALDTSHFNDSPQARRNKNSEKGGTLWCASVEYAVWEAMCLRCPS